MRTRPPCKLLFIAKGTLRDSGRKHFWSTSQRKTNPLSTPHPTPTRHHNPSSPTVFFFLRSSTSRNVNPLLLARLLLFHHSRNQKKKSVCSLQEEQARPRPLKMQYTKLLISRTSFLLAFFLALRGLLPSSCKTHFVSKIHRPEEDEEEDSDITQSPKNLPMKNLLLFLLLLLLATSWNPSEPCSLRPTSNNHQTHHHFFLQKMSTSCNNLEPPSEQSSRSFRRTLAASKSLSPSNFKTLVSASKYLLNSQLQNSLLSFQISFNLPTSKLSSQLQISFNLPTSKLSSQLPNHFNLPTSKLSSQLPNLSFTFQLQNSLLSFQISLLPSNFKTLFSAPNLSFTFQLQNSLLNSKSLPPSNFKNSLWDLPPTLEYTKKI